MRYQLLISHIEPHREVKNCTISRWLKDMLNLSGIDTTQFKEHSTRSASTSKAKLSGGYYGRHD